MDDKTRISALPLAAGLLAFANTAGAIGLEADKADASQIFSSLDNTRFAQLAPIADFPDIAAAPIAPMDQLNRLYGQADALYLAASQLAAAAYLFDKPISDLNALYNDDELAGIYIGKANLAIAVALTGKRVSDINALYDDAEGSNISKANLAAAAALSGKSIADLNQLYRQAAGLYIAASQLAAAAAIFDLPISKLNELYGQAAGIKMAKSSLAIAAALSPNKTMQDINQLYNGDDPAPGAVLGARSSLAAVSVVADKPIKDMNRLYDAAAGIYAAKSNLAVAAALSKTDKTQAKLGLLLMLCVDELN